MKKRKILNLSLLITLMVFVLVLAGCKAETTSQSSETGSTQAANGQSEGVEKTDDGQFVGLLDGQPVPSLEGKTIGLALIGTTLAFDRQSYKHVVQRIEELGGKAIVTDAERNDQKAIADLENLITQKPDAIIKNIGDTDVFMDISKKVVDAGIPYFTIEHQTPHSITNFSQDNFSGGTKMAVKMFEDMGGEGKVAVFNGFYGVDSCSIRYDMMKYVAQKKYPNVEFIEPELQDVIPGTIEDAKRKVQDLLTKYPSGSDFKAVWACWDEPQIGSAMAIDAAGRSDEVKVYGSDADPGALEMIADPDSSFEFTMMADHRRLNGGAVDAVARYLAGEEPKAKSVYVDIIPVDESNAMEILETHYND